VIQRVNSEELIIRVPSVPEYDITYPEIIEIVAPRQAVLTDRAILASNVLTIRPAPGTAHLFFHFFEESSQQMALLDPALGGTPITQALITSIVASIYVVDAAAASFTETLDKTIVIFDRLRELRGKSAYVTAAMIDKAVNQTLSRTILTSGTAFLATLILYLFGGQGIHAFAFTMLVGIITGTYSTIYIAAPLVLWLQEGASAARREQQTSRSKPQLSA
jgi:hypothetical protein